MKLYIIFNKILKMTEKKKICPKTIAIFSKVYYNINCKDISKEISCVFPSGKERLGLP